MTPVIIYTFDKRDSARLNRTTPLELVRLASYLHGKGLFECSPYIKMNNTIRLGLSPYCLLLCEYNGLALATVRDRYHSRPDTAELRKKFVDEINRQLDIGCHISNSSTEEDEFYNQNARRLAFYTALTMSDAVAGDHVDHKRKPLFKTQQTNCQEL